MRRRAVWKRGAGVLIGALLLAALLTACGDMDRERPERFVEFAREFRWPEPAEGGERVYPIR